MNSFDNKFIKILNFMFSEVIIPNYLNFFSTIQIDVFLLSVEFNNITWQNANKYAKFTDKSCKFFQFIT